LKRQAYESSKIQYLQEGLYGFKELKLFNNENPNLLIWNDDVTSVIDDVVNIDILPIKQLQKILDGLSDSRVNNRDYWLRVGYYLSNYSDGNLIFENWSKQSNKYNPERHNYDWESIKSGKSKINIGTLMMYLKEDNIELFEEIIRDNRLLAELDKVTIDKGIKNTVITKISQKQIEVACDIKIEEITMLHDIKYKNCRNCDIYGTCDDTGYILLCKSCKFSHPQKRIPIDKDITPTVFNMLIINNSEDISNKDTSQVADFVIKRKKLLYVPKQWYLFNDISGIYEKRREEDIIVIVDKIFNDDNEEWAKWVKKIDYKEKVIKELKTKCIIPIEVELDNNPTLLGFSNGVFDLSKNEFRSGLESEYITMICKYPYNPDVDESLANEILHTTFQNNEERDYAIYRFCLILEGKNREQTLTFNYGFTASNGKSFLMERISNLMGDYGDCFNVNLITNKMSLAGDANSTLIGFKNKRFMYCSEPEAGAKLNTNFVKLLTGDRIKARGLYAHNDEVIKLTYNIFVCCNALPEFDSYDEGIARRIKLIEYSTKFTENPKKIYEKKIKHYDLDDLILIEMGLMNIFIRNYYNLKQLNFYYIEPDKLNTLKLMYINTNKDDIKILLNEKFQYGNDDDYTQIRDIKDFLKSYGIIKDNISIRYIIQDLYPDTLFFDRKYFNNIHLRCVFFNLKLS
jgi:hypothetical protein